jgi:hypothetical protein
MAVAIPHGEPFEPGAQRVRLFAVRPLVVTPSRVPKCRRGVL